MPQKRMEWFRMPFEHLAKIEHAFLNGIRDSRKARSLSWMIRGVRGVRESIYQSWLAKGSGLGLLCWGFKGIQEFIPSEEVSTLQIGSVAFPQGQCITTPSFSQTIWPRWTSKQFLTLPIVQGLLPMTWYSLSSEAVVMRQLRRWKRLWHWHAHTSGLPWGLPEVVGTIQVHCSRRRLLRRGLEFHVCTFIKSAHTKKVLKLIVCSSYFILQ